MSINILSLLLLDGRPLSQIRIKLISSSLIKSIGEYKL